MLTSSITPSSSTPLSSSSSSSSSFASSIANGVRSIYAAAFAAACSMLGIGEYSAGESFDLGVGVSTVRSEDDVDVDGVAIVDEPSGAWGLKLACDDERRIVGVSRDSRALGSSNDVILPMAGRWYTCTAVSVNSIKASIWDLYLVLANRSPDLICDDVEQLAVVVRRDVGPQRPEHGGI